jgi:hypothetical protein
MRRRSSDTPRMSGTDIKRTTFSPPPKWRVIPVLAAAFGCVVIVLVGMSSHPTNNVHTPTLAALPNPPSQTPLSTVPSGGVRPPGGPPTTVHEVHAAAPPMSGEAAVARPITTSGQPPATAAAAVRPSTVSPNGTRPATAAETLGVIRDLTTVVGGTIDRVLISLSDPTWGAVHVVATSMNHDSFIPIHHLLIWQIVESCDEFIPADVQTDLAQLINRCG